MTKMYEITLSESLPEEAVEQVFNAIRNKEERLERDTEVLSLMPHARTVTINNVGKSQNMKLYGMIESTIGQAVQEFRHNEMSQDNYTKEELESFHPSKVIQSNKLK